MKKILLITSILTAFTLSAYAEVNLDDITSPKETFFRFGTTDTPENKLEDILNPNEYRTLLQNFIINNNLYSSEDKIKKS